MFTMSPGMAASSEKFGELMAYASTVCFVILLVFQGLSLFVHRKETKRSSGGLTVIDALDCAMKPLAVTGLISSSYWITVLLQSYGDGIIDFIDGPLLIPLGIVCGIFFYALRMRQPFMYGLTELLVAIVVIWLSGHSISGNLLSKGFGLLGGVYIFVRGLDNMNKRLPSSWSRKWNALFIGQRPPPK